MSGLSDRVPVLLQGAQALVFELEQILGIEKLRSVEERVSDPSMARVEGAGGLEGLAFAGGGIVGHMCKCIYAVIYFRQSACPGK